MIVSPPTTIVLGIPSQEGDTISLNERVSPSGRALYKFPVKGEVPTMELITRTRGKQNLENPVIVPVYPANVKNAEWNDLPEMIPVNVSGSSKIGVRSKLNAIGTLTDVKGLRVGMLTDCNGSIERDIVTLIGATNTGVIVKFDDENQLYTVSRANVRFVNGVE